MKLKDRVALITGAGSGIGKACAERFAQEGAHVVVTDIAEDAGTQVAAQIGGSFYRLDVADPARFEAAVKDTVERHGKLDILVSNAGIDGEQALTGNHSIDNWLRVVDVNLNGVFYGMKYALAQMAKQGSGVVLTIASIAGIIGFPGLPAYAATKGGVINLTRAVAIEYASKGIRVNAIAPSAVRTPLLDHAIAKSPDPAAMRARMENLNPLPGIIPAEAIASAALFLASDEAAFITGHTLPVDGGYLAQ